MKKNFKFVVAAVAAVAMIGCAKDGGEKIAPADKGAATTANFKINFNATRALDDSATGAEAKLNSAVVFLFDDATKTLESRTVMTIAGDGKTASATGVKTVTSKHYIYVAVNAPAALMGAFNALAVADPDPDAPVVGATMASFLALTNPAATYAALIGSTGTANSAGFFMTAYKEVTFEAPTIDVPSPAANNVSMGLGRAVGKAHLESALVSFPENATVPDASVKYKAMNNPKEVYAFQQYEMPMNAGANRAPVRNFIDNDGADRTDYFRVVDDVAKTNYTAASNTALAGVYVPENWNSIPTTHNATSLIIQGQIVFDDGFMVRKADGTATAVGGGVYAGGDTFYRVWDKQKGDWLKSESGNTYIFCEVPGTAGASMDMLLGAAGKDPLFTTGFISTEKYTMDTTSATDYEFFIATYDDAKAYWRLPLKADGRSTVARNDYFWVTLKTIADIGASTDSDDPDDDGVLPEDPEPIDEIEVDINATITILKWNGIGQEGNV